MLYGFLNCHTKNNKKLCIKYLRKYLNDKRCVKMQFGMPTLVENRSFEDNVTLCKELGLNFIELNMNLPEYQIDKLENTEYFLKAANDAKIYY